MRHHVFLSYSRRDNDIMQRIKSRLQHANLIVWTDEGIDPGTRSWRKEVEDALLSTGCVVCILSPHANQSQWVRAELEFAEIQETPILLLLAKGDERTSIPFGFSTFQWIDIRNPAVFEDQISVLISSVHDRVNKEQPKPSQLRLPLLNTMPYPFDWCEIPAGSVNILHQSDQTPPSHIGGLFELPPFIIAKYPITNAQFNQFIDSDDGYKNPAWWGYSIQAMRWREKHKHPNATAYSGRNLPRTSVSWFDAVAYCRWLSSSLTDYFVSLPTEQQWQRAAQGDDERLFPWGYDYDISLANTILSNIKQPTPVAQYPEGVSPFGVMDMGGNTFDWCISQWGSGSNDLNGNEYRAIRGGSWGNYYRVARLDKRRGREPSFFDASTGFRIVLIRK